MSSLEDFSKSDRAFPNASRDKKKHPKGWEPGIDTARKEITSRPMSKAMNPADHRWDKYLEDLGFKSYRETFFSLYLLLLRLFL